MNDIETDSRETAREKTEIKAGDRVRMVLVVSKHTSSERMSRGIESETFEGTAGSDLTEGESFWLDFPGGPLRTSRVQRVGSGMFTTMNSTYSVEKIK